MRVEQEHSSFQSTPPDCVAVLQADGVVSEAEVAQARAASLQWAADSCYALLPWSSIILEVRFQFSVCSWRLSAIMAISMRP